MQLPILTKHMIDRLKSEAQVEDVADFMNMEDDVRSKLVALPAAKMEALAAVCNRYPSMDLEVSDAANIRVCFSPESDVTDLKLEVQLIRDIDKDDFETEQEYQDELKALSAPVNARFYPLEKDEVWWIIVGSATAGSIMSIKRVQLRQKAFASHMVNLEISRSEIQYYLSSRGDLALKVYAVCDAYLGCDLEKNINLAVTGI